mgnify:CR=1 FL=1
MKKIEHLTLDRLKEMKEVVSSYGSMEELNHDLNFAIATREEEKAKSLNVRFNMSLMKKLHVFDPWELKVVESNNIANLQELIDCNLDELVGITPSIKEGLEWVRTFYDMSSFKEEDKPMKK